MPTITDKIYGKLTWDEEIGEGWQGSVELEPGLTVEIAVWSFDPMDFLAVRQTHNIFEKIRRRKVKFFEFLADDLREQYNEEWRPENEKWIDRKAFLEKLKNELVWDSISFQENGTAYIIFTTEMFEGYSVVLNLDKNGDCVDVELV